MSFLPFRSSWFEDRSIATKINIVTIALFLVVFGICGALLSGFLSKRLEQSATDNLKASNIQIIRMIEAFSTELEKSAQMLGGAFSAEIAEALVRNDNTAMDRAVGSFSTATGSIATIFVREGEDFIRKSTSLRDTEGKRVLGTALDRESPAFKAIASGQPYTGRATLFSKNYMTRYIPIRNSANTIIGAAFIGIDFTEALNALKKQIRETKVGDTGYVFVVERKGDVGRAIVHPSLEGQSILDVKADGDRFIVREMLEQGQGTIRYRPSDTNLKQQDKVAVFNAFDHWNWVVVSGSFLDEFTANASAVIKALILSCLGTVLVIAIAIQMITGIWLRKPLSELGSIFSKISGGDLRVAISVRNNDEVGQLLSACRTMCEQLRTMVAGIQSGMHELSTNAESLSITAEEVAIGSHDQSNESMSLASAIEELATSIEQMSSHSEQTQEIVRKSDAVSRSGAAVISDAVESMNSIAGAVREAAEVVSRLGTEAEKITQVVAVIREIAEQTNLLALNAAIEAARAGESGRGFAVVADEVRKLAERTTIATTEIGATIQHIQNGTNEAVTSMRAGVAQVDTGVALAGKAGACIGEMQDGAAQVGRAVVGISDGLREQTTVSENVARNVEEIAQQAESNLARARQLADSSAHMQKIAADTLHSVKRFEI